jgi:flagellar biosynthesis chaperone FliJ
MKLCRLAEVKKFKNKITIDWKKIHGQTQAYTNQLRHLYQERYEREKKRQGL